VGDCAFSTWLYRVVVNTWRGYCTWTQADCSSSGNVAAEGLAAQGSQEDDLANKQMAISIRTAISALPAKFRLAILLRYFEDLSYQEMASVLNCSMGTVASRLSRGHRMLAGKLEPLRVWFRKGQS
jgi:RNA polymerase sigma-70 factor, ECF subfamily